MEFDKFYIKKKSWWNTGNFEIYDEENALSYTVKSNPWGLKKQMELHSVHNEVIYQIISTSFSGSVYEIHENNRTMAHIEKPFSWSNPKFEIETLITEPFSAVGNVWGNEYKFKRGDKEFGIVSYKIWSSGDFGIAIKKGEPIPLLLCVIIIIAYLKQNGLA